LAETTNGLYKAECVYGPDANGWVDVDELELATLSWVYWFNHDRLHGYCNDVPPAEFEANWTSNTSSPNHPNATMISTAQSGDGKPNH